MSRGQGPIGPVDEGRMRARAYGLALLAIALAAGAALRLYGLNWDQGFFFHPDERKIIMVAEELHLPRPWSWRLVFSAESPLNPRFFAYGSLPLYLVKGLSAVFGRLWPALYEMERMLLIGRALSVLFDLGTMFLAYHLGTRLYDERVGGLAALFMAFSVLHIQLSHFYTVDTLLTFFVLATVWLAVELSRRGELKIGVLAGIACGLTLAIKVSALPLVGTLALAWVLAVRGGLQAPRLRRWLKALAGAVLFGVLVTVVFLVSEPYALLDWKMFLTWMAKENAMVQGLSDVEYTRQYIGTPPYLYHIQQAVLWSMGPLLGATAFGGLAFAIGRGLLRRKREEWVVLSWVLVYFALTGSFRVKYLRYMLPLSPLLLIMGAKMLISGGDWLRRRNLPEGLEWVAPGCVAAFSLLYSLAFVNIYSEEHPWIQASRWIYANIPPGTSLAVEHWDDPLPFTMQVDGRWRDSDEYVHQVLELYEEDDGEKLAQLVAKLVASDYIILASNRLYGTIPRLPERYPLTTRYYQRLFGEELGFELIHFVAVYPKLWGVVLADDTLGPSRLPVPMLLTYYRPSSLTLNLWRADESFSVYDHPKVLIFKKMQEFSREELYGLLGGSL